MAAKLLSELAKGTWDSGTAYTIGDIVDYLSSSYICIANNTNQTPPNATYWAILSKGIVPKGAYDNGTDYNVGEYVSYQGSSYIMYVNAAAGTLPTDTTKWQIVASKGDTGATGAAGATGSQGPQGDEVELRVSGGYIQWKLTADVSWTNLIATSALTGATGAAGNDGTEIELQNSGTHIQWRYVGAVSWTNLVALSAITGPQGDPGTDGESFVWEGPWVTSTAYQVNDVVSNSGNSYICLIAHTSGTFGTDLSAGKWELLAQKGADGVGAGDVLGPASNSDTYIPQWDGVDSKTLKNGLALDTDLTSVSASDDSLPSAKAVKTYADLKVTANAGITGATKTKITYDAKGLVTAGADATTADIADSADKRYVTDAQLTVIGNTSGTNTGDQDLSVLVPKSLFDANTILYATSDNTPLALTVGASTIVGRKATGDIVALTATETRTILNVADGATANTKASGAEVDTGTDDAKFVTAKAMEDSAYIKAAYADALVIDSIADSDTTHAPSRNAVFDALALKLSLSGGTLTGEVDLGENAGLVLDSALSADGKYSGIVESGTAGAALAFGDLCYLDPTDSRWELADANAAAGADGDSRGKLGICVLAAGADGNATKMLLWGKVRADAAFPAMTINNPLYVSETAGDITGTQPTTTDVVIRVVGFANTADELFFNPSPDYITHT